MFSGDLSLAQHNRIIIDINMAVIQYDRAEVRLEQERRQSYNFPSTDMETEVTLPPAILMVDGDTSQIEDIVQYLERSPDGLDVAKHAGGCTALYQSNDDGNMHSCLKDNSKNAASSNILKPAFLDHFVRVLRTKGMKGESVDVYSSFLHILFFIFSKSTTQSIIDRSWRIAGIIDGRPNKDVILGAISSYNVVSPINAASVNTAMDALKEHVDSHFKVDEKHMQLLIKDIMSTDIDPDKSKTIGQERTMFLTCPAAILERQRKIDLKKQEAIAKKRADQAKAKKKAEKEAAILKDKNDLATLFVKEGRPPVSCSCANAACPISFNSTATLSIAEAVKADKWNMCPTCEAWFCSAKSCLTLLVRHRGVCNMRRAGA